MNYFIAFLFTSSFILAVKNLQTVMVVAPLLVDEKGSSRNRAMLEAFAKRGNLEYWTFVVFAFTGSMLTVYQIG